MTLNYNISSSKKVFIIAGQPGSGKGTLSRLIDNIEYISACSLIHKDSKLK